MNKTISTHPLQTPQWGEFRKEWGNDVTQIHYGSKDKNTLFVTFSKVPFTKLVVGTALRGLVPTKEQLEELKQLGRKKNAIFIKLEPNVLEDSNANESLQLLKKYCVKGKRLFTEETFWIDLTKSEEDLLKSFSSKTRYNIRVAQKHGVEVSEDSSDEAFEKYLKLTFETAKRQRFFAHTPEYHRLMWKHLGGKIAHLLVAKYKGEILTTWIVFKKDAFLYYPYGASSDNHREVMANNLMMWETIRFGKKMGCSMFDLWGREEGKGFTRFKEGYNPQVVRFIGSWDLVVNKPIYQLYKIAEWVRWFFLKRILSFFK